MYVADTLKRVNDAEYKRLMSKNHGTVFCDYCEEHSKHIIPVYNPADFARGMKHEPYFMINVCQEHYDAEWYMEESFYCECGDLFIVNHSWDVVCTTIDDELYCQKCALDMINPIRLDELLSNLRNDFTYDFLRINGVPGKNPIFECEFSEYSDFPGLTSLASVARDLEYCANKPNMNVAMDDLIIPLVTHGYQFSVCLGFYKA